MIPKITNSGPITWAVSITGVAKLVLHLVASKLALAQPAVLSASTFASMCMVLSMAFIGRSPCVGQMCLAWRGDPCSRRVLPPSILVWRRSFHVLGKDACDFPYMKHGNRAVAA